MEKYMFIFIGGDASHLSPEKQEAQMNKWFAWVQKLQEQGRYDSGEALLPSGKTIRSVKKTVTDGPYAESKEIIAGYFVVTAKDLAEATELAKEYPDFELDGVIEIREVVKFDNM
jgi:hypothetical protein